MIENTILSNLAFQEEYSRKVLPFIKEEYFNNDYEKTIFRLINNYIQEYNAFPTKEALQIDLNNTIDTLNETTFNQSRKCIDEMFIDEGTNLIWLVDQTEKFCQDAAIRNGILASISILDDKTGKLPKTAIPKILQDALSVSFDTHIGHDFSEDWLNRYNFYHNIEEKISFHLDFFNKITNGGLARKTLTVILAGTGVGKTRAMTHFASDNLRDGKNVLYITLEMSEERIAERVDANLLDIPIQELPVISKDEYQKKIEKMKSKTKGRLIIKEYPTTGASATTFRNLLNELKIKKNFVPDIIYIDYINLCSSSRLKNTGAVNSYTLIKSIAEEIRGLAVEYDVPIISATQTNRDGYASSDVELTNTSECIYVNETVKLRDGTIKPIGEIKFGEQIISNDGYKTVLKTHHPKQKECVKITLKNGKTIIVSKDHVFPTSRGRISINSGNLKVGDKLNSE